MRRYFTKTFFHFLFGFVAILVVAFGVLIAGVQLQTTTAAVAEPMH